MKTLSAEFALLTPENVSKHLQVSLSWLAKARMRGDGPPFIKIGRSIRYSDWKLEATPPNTWPTPEQLRACVEPVKFPANMSEGSQICFLPSTERLVASPPVPPET